MHLQRIDSYVDGQVAAVAFVDLEQVRVDTDVDRLLDLAPLSDDVRREVVAPTRLLAKTLVGELLAAGCTHLYAVATLADFNHNTGPLIIAPVAEGGSPPTVAKLLSGGRGDGPTSESADSRSPQRRSAACRLNGNLVVSGGEARLDQMESLTPTPRPDLGEALADVAGSAAAAVVSLDADTRRVIRQMFPRLPDPLGAATGPLVADGIRWIALGISLSPHLDGRFVLKASSAESVVTIRELIMRGWETLVMLPAVQEVLPSYEEVVTLVTPRTEDDRLTIPLGGEGELLEQLVRLWTLQVQTARQAGRREPVRDDLKQLALALHCYHDTNKSFPPSAIRDAQGNALLSWRVEILPYLHQKELYSQFHLDEPWDSEHNRNLIERMPAVFSSFESKGHEKGHANFLAPVGEDLAFFGSDGIAIAEFTDGVSNTILLVEVDRRYAVIWTKPDDLTVDLDRPLHRLVAEDRDDFLAAFADGRVLRLDKAIDAGILRALFTRNGGELIDWHLVSKHKGEPAGLLRR